MFVAPRLVLYGAIALACTAPRPPVFSTAGPHATPDRAAGSRGPERSGATRNAPPFDANDLPLGTLDRRAVRLSDFGTNVVVIAVWATHCGPCRAELPRVEALHQRYVDDADVSIVAVSVDELDDEGVLDDVAEMAEDLGLTMPILVDHELAVSHRFSRTKTESGDPIVPLPMLVVIDASFTFQRHVGFFPRETTEQFVARYSRQIELARAGSLRQEQGL